MQKYFLIKIIVLGSLGFLYSVPQKRKNYHDDAKILRYFGTGLLAISATIGFAGCVCLQNSDYCSITPSAFDFVVKSTVAVGGVIPGFLLLNLSQKIRSSMGYRLEHYVDHHPGRQVVLVFDNHEDEDFAPEDLEQENFGS